MIMSVAKPAIENIMTQFVLPKLETFGEYCKLTYNTTMITKGEHFSEYLHRMYKKLSIINTLAFRNNQQYLVDIYQPLTIIKEDSRLTNSESISVKGYVYEIMNKYQNILITDTAGMGKSTLSKKMFLDIIDNGYGIPFFIELRRLNKNKGILDDIQEQLNSLTKEFDQRLLLELIKTGGFIFFFDGYDEISLNDKSHITDEVQGFVSKAGNGNFFILTSRPENSLSSFGDFQGFKINPLKKKEAYELLRKYDKQGETSKLLIEKLKSGDYEMIDEFLGTPLLVSLLFCAFDYEQTIPLKKHIFYAQVFDALFYTHDLSKGNSYTHNKTSGLGVDEFKQILRCLGFECMKLQKVEFNKEELLEVINQAKKICIGINFNASDLLDDLLGAVPLFCQDGLYYRWAHKSLQEYFASMFIFIDSRTDKDRILKSMYESEKLEKYSNTLDIYSDIDRYAFDKNIAMPFYQEYQKYYNNIQYNLPRIPKKIMDVRIYGLFLREIFYCVECAKDGIDLNNSFNRFMKNLIKTKKNINTGFGTRNANHSFNLLGEQKSKRSITKILIAKKYLNVFNIINNNQIASDIVFDAISIEEVTISTFGDDILKYEELNKMILSGDTRHSNLKQYYIDIDKCSDEIARINKVIEDTENLELFKNL